MLWFYWWGALIFSLSVRVCCEMYNEVNSWYTFRNSEIFENSTPKSAFSELESVVREWFALSFTAEENRTYWRLLHSREGGDKTFRRVNKPCCLTASQAPLDPESTTGTRGGGVGSDCTNCHVKAWISIPLPCFHIESTNLNEPVYYVTLAFRADWITAAYNEFAPVKQ